MCNDIEKARILDVDLKCKRAFPLCQFGRLAPHNIHNLQFGLAPD